MNARPASEMVLLFRQKRAFCPSERDSREVCGGTMDEPASRTGGWVISCGVTRGHHHPSRPRTAEPHAGLDAQLALRRRKTATRSAASRSTERPEAHRAPGRHLTDRPRPEDDQTEGASRHPEPVDPGQPQRHASAPLTWDNRANHRTLQRPIPTGEPRTESSMSSNPTHEFLSGTSAEVVAE